VAYTDDAMISVLQKAEELVNQGKSFNTLKNSFTGKDELDCYEIAHSKQYVKYNHYNSLVMTTGGQDELARLLNVKTEKRRENLRTNLRIATLVVSTVGTLIMICTFWATLKNRTTVLEQPIKVEGAVEVLLPPLHQVPSDNGGEVPNASESDSDTCKTNTSAQ